MSHTEWDGFCPNCNMMTKHWTIYASHVSTQCRVCYHGERFKRFWVGIILEPIINKEGNVWKYTCADCWIPDKVPVFTKFGKTEWECEWVRDEPDYVTTHRISKRTGELGKKPVNFPDRCLACKAAYRRATRMGKRIDRIYTKAGEQASRGLRYPKLITFALPHAEYHDVNNIEDRETCSNTEQETS